MSAHHPPPAGGGQVTARLRRVIAGLAAAARSGPVGAVTVLTHTSLLDALACELARAEATLDSLTDEAREMEQAHHIERRARLAAFLAAQDSGKVLLFPVRTLPPHAGWGGAA